MQILRPSTSVVRLSSVSSHTLPIPEAHALRLECAADHLPLQPIRDYGLNSMIMKAKANVGVTVGPDVLDWLPRAENHFYGL